MRMITLLDRYNRPIAINSTNIIAINEDPLHEGGSIIDMINGKSIMIPMTIEEVVTKINSETSDLGKMCDALCGRIQHLEDAMAAGMRYTGRSYR